MRKFIFFDSFSVESFHEVFNSSSLVMFSKIYDDVEYYGALSSKKTIESIMGNLPQNVTYHRIYQICGKSRLGVFLKNLYALFYNVWIVLFSKSDTVVYFNYNTIWPIPVINRILKYKKNVSVICMFHGELRFIENNQKKLNVISQSVLSRIISPYFIPNKRMFFCVLGKSIYDNLKLIVPHSFVQQCIYFEHTFIPDEQKDDGPIKLGDNHVKVGVIGVIHKDKSLDNIIKLSQTLKCVQNISLYAIGRVQCDETILKENRINYIKGYGDGFIPNSILHKYIKSMDILVFLYDKDSYKLMASGAIYDAINYGRTIYAIRNSYFQHLFERTSVGLLFDSIDDIVVQLKKIVSMADTDQKCIKPDKYFFQPENEAKSLAIRLEKRGLL